MSNPKISVVTVCYNAVDTIEETILSVINQTYQNIEYIIVDGASNDGTYEKICEYADKIDVIIHEKDCGIFDAMNKSLNHIEGDYVIFMNSGDKFVNERVVESVFMNQGYTADLVYGDVYIQTQYGFNLILANPIYMRHFTQRDLVFKSQGISHQSLFTKSSLLKRIRFDVRFPIGADYDTTYKIFMYGNHELVYAGIPVSIFDRRMGGFSNGKIVKMYKERIAMFNYTPTLKDLVVIYFEGFIDSLKGYFKFLFPFLINSRYKTSVREL